jgi:hypothetical protein
VAPHLLNTQPMPHDTMTPGRRLPPGVALARDTCGAVSTEYVIVVGAVGLVVAGALLAAGPKVLAGYEHSRDVLSQPFP